MFFGMIGGLLLFLIISALSQSLTAAFWKPGVTTPYLGELSINSSKLVADVYSLLLVPVLFLIIRQSTYGLFDVCIFSKLMVGGATLLYNKFCT